MSNPIAGQVTVSRFLSKEIVRSASTLELIARQTVEGFMTGLHKSPHHGTSLEFAEYRKYVPGDPPNFIDWKAYARMDRYYIKVFHDETNLAATLLLDGSRSMSEPAGTPPDKFTYAKYLAAAFAYLLAKQQDAVGLEIARGKKDVSVPPRSGMAAMNEMFGLMEAATADGNPPLAEKIHRLAEARKKRGMFLVMSDLFAAPDEIKHALGHLRHSGHEVALFQILAPEEIEFPYDGLLDFEDAETGERMPLEAGFARGEYIERLNVLIGDYRDFAAHNGIDFRTVRTDEKLDRVFSDYLLARRRKR